MKRCYIDSASLHSLCSALVQGRNSDWTPWERKAVAEVTLGLLFGNVVVPAPPQPGRHPEPHLVEQICRVLQRFVSERGPAPAVRARALKATQDWACVNARFVTSQFKRLRADPSTEPFLRWAVARSWTYHVSRLKNLVDVPLVGEVARILGWSRTERNKIVQRGGDIEKVRLFSESFRQTGELPPGEIIDGYLVSLLIRGRYYQELAATRAQPGSYIWHAMRDYVLSSVQELTSLETYRERLIHVLLAGLICGGAMEEKSELEIAMSWAENIRKLRGQILDIPPENDFDRAAEQVVSLARRCKLELRWERCEQMLDWAVHSFVMPLVGIAAGLVVLATGSGHGVSIASHLGAEMIVRPYTERCARSILEVAEGSKFHIGKLAKEGIERVFAVTKEDLKLPA